LIKDDKEKKKINSAIEIYSLSLSLIRCLIDSSDSLNIVNVAKKINE